MGEQCPGGPAWASRNSGVMIHCQPVETMRMDQEFPVSIEVQFLGGDGKKERATGNACTPGTHIVMDGKLVKTHTINSRAKTYPGDQWVTVEVEVHGGDVIKHIVNGETVLEYEKPQYDDRDPDARKLIRDGGRRRSRRATSPSRPRATPSSSARWRSCPWRSEVGGPDAGGVGEVAPGPGDQPRSANSLRERVVIDGLDHMLDQISARPGAAAVAPPGRSRGRRR